ncbi:MAG: c-type cytochrome [Pseudobacteriovorax sp.]|nr:c-type cytochrome [Pseudobacteriovorax sp.]
MRSITGLVFALLLVTACDFNDSSDYNPKEDFEAFQEKQAKLAESQKNAAATQSPEELAAAAAKQDYQTFCSSCHGADGAANTPTALAMNPKPRNLTDGSWQASVDDAHITKVIKEGGPAVGLSATMAPWGAALSDEKIAGIVTYIRGMK